MIERNYLVTNPVGLHARPASLLVKVAQKYRSSVRIEKDEAAANAKSILSLLTLGANCGSQVRIIIDGLDENEAMQNILETLDQISREDAQ